MSKRTWSKVLEVAVPVALIGIIGFLLMPVEDAVPQAPARNPVQGVACESGAGVPEPVEEEEPIREPASPAVAVAEEDSTAEESLPKTAEEQKEAVEQAKVEAFDDLTDAWMEPKAVAMKDVDDFVKAFRAVPKARQDECVQRALNLIPDENVLLLAGILTDKSFDREIIETVFNDILNRGEDVKKPILELVYKDQTHPCWADTAWIFDVTGETPATE